MHSVHRFFYVRKWDTCHKVEMSWIKEKGKKAFKKVFAVLTTVLPGVSSEAFIPILYFGLLFFCFFWSGTSCVIDILQPRFEILSVPLALVWNCPPGCSLGIKCLVAKPWNSNTDSESVSRVHLHRLAALRSSGASHDLGWKSRSVSAGAL